MSPHENLLTPGHQEGFKACIHGVLLLSVGTVASYNVAAFRARHEPRLLVNAIVYAALAVFEIVKMSRHWRET